MIIFRNCPNTWVGLRVHQESWFGPEQTEQNSIDKIAIIMFRQLVIVGSRPQIIYVRSTI